MEHRTAAMVVFLCDGLAAFQQIVVDVVKERLGTFGEIGSLGMPVVHLQIDVGMVVGVPRCMQIAAPYTLQVCRQRLAAAGGQQKISAELEVEIDKTYVGPACLDAFQTFVCGKCIDGFIVVVSNVGAGHDRREVRDMLCHQIVK